MLPDPLHPAIVHFPIAFSVVVPFMIVISLVLMRKGKSVTTAWIPVFGLVALMFVGALVSKNTGENEEEKVEEVVPENAIHDHEEKAELFTILAGVLLAISAAGFLPAKWGRSARYLTAAMSLVVLFAAYQTGETGGDLVYEHGAASAYVGPGSASGIESVESDSTSSEQGDDD